MLCTVDELINYLLISTVPPIACCSADFVSESCTLPQMKNMQSTIATRVGVLAAVLLCCCLLLCPGCRFDLTWGPIEYHRRSLDNLQTAMRQSRKLCAIVLDTLGREVGPTHPGVFATYCWLTCCAPLAAVPAVRP
jgi:hypothetical protein